jgi:hypothetical protein
VLPFNRRNEAKNAATAPGVFSRTLENRDIQGCTNRDPIPPQGLKTLR